VPTIQEFMTIVDLGSPTCQIPWPSPGCIDPMFAPTLPDLTWSATTRASNPARAWAISFSDGTLHVGGKVDHAARESLRVALPGRVEPVQCMSPRLLPPLNP
jgi:hypothetical protein